MGAVMGIARKGRRKFNHDDVDYLWWVIEDYETYSPGDFFHAHITRCDKKLMLVFQLGQAAETCHLVVRTQSGPCRRFRCPVFTAGPAFTPNNVKALLEWYHKSCAEAEEVNYLGLPLR
jgi:hypothetical protein